MKKLKYIPLVIIILFLVFWLISVIKVELLTWKHVSEFAIPDEVIAWTGEWNNTKVIDYTNDYARVYNNFGSHLKSGAAGFSTNFTKENGTWEYESWGAVWSSYGSADDFVWPYWYHSAGGWALFLFLGAWFLIISIILLLLSGRKRQVKET